MNSKQKALVIKDIRAITSNKRLFSVMLIVPLVMTLVLPTVFILIIAFTPLDSGDLEEIVRLLPQGLSEEGIREASVGFFLNSIIPGFFMMIPIMASSVMAASSFVGEKEKRTLETLLMSPLSLREIFTAKILASFLLSMAVSFASFILMTAAMEAELKIFLGSFVLPNANWLVIMLLISPAVSILAITLTVRGSAKAQTVEESQQRAVFLILPILLLVGGQLTGLINVNAAVLAVVGAVAAALAVLFMRGAYGKFSYESLLR